MKRFALGASLAALSLTAGAAPAGASVTIGQTGPPTGLCSQNQDWAQLTVSSGSSYVVPSIPPTTALSITSWSHQAYSTAGQRLRLKLYRQVSGLTYMVVAQEARSLVPSVLNTFPTSISVKPGDVLGITNAGDTPLVGCGFGPFTETDHWSNGTDAPTGGTVTFAPISGARLDVSAVVEPTNTFSLGQTTRNKRKGTATLNLTLPNPGELTGSGDGAKVASVAGAVISKSVPAGPAQLLIKAKRKKKRKLNETGKVTLKPKITYTPTGGDPRTQSIKVKLKKKL